MTSPFEHGLGTVQGRIAPVNATPTDGDVLFCLGTDRVPAQLFNMRAGDYAEISQLVTLDGGLDLIRFSTRLRQPSTMPRPLALSTPVEIERTITTVGVATREVNRLRVADATFDSGMIGRIIRIEGAAFPIDNGDHEISTVEDETTVLLKLQARSDLGTYLDIAPGTAILLGARWSYQILFDGTEVMTYDQEVGFDRIFENYAINVSRFPAGDHTVTLRMRLVEETV